MTPPFTITVNETNHMRDVIWAKTDGENQQRPHRQPNGPESTASSEMRQIGEDSYEVYVAEAADGQGYTEQYEKKLQTNRKQNVKLLCGEVIVQSVGTGNSQ